MRECIKCGREPVTKIFVNSIGGYIDLCDDCDNDYQRWVLRNLLDYGVTQSWEIVVAYKDRKKEEHEEKKTN